MSPRSRPLMFAAAALLGIALGGCEKGFLSKHSEQSVALSQVPAPVKATIDKQSGGGAVKEIEKRSQNGKTVYTASISQNGVEQHVAIAEDGTLLGTVKANEDDDD